MAKWEYKFNNLQRHFKGSGVNGIRSAVAHMNIHSCVKRSGTWLGNGPWEKVFGGLKTDWGCARCVCTFTPCSWLVIDVSKGKPMFLHVIHWTTNCWRLWFGYRDQSPFISHIKDFYIWHTFKIWIHAFILICYLSSIPIMLVYGILESRLTQELHSNLKKQWLHLIHTIAFWMNTGRER